MARRRHQTGRVIIRGKNPPVFVGRWREDVIQGETTIRVERSKVLGTVAELKTKRESQGDHRASIVALREVRECLESLGEMLAKATTPQGSQFDLAQRIEAARRRVREHKEAETNASKNC